MKTKHLQYLAVSLAIGALSLPAGAQACKANTMKHCCTMMKHHHKMSHCCMQMCHMQCQIKPAHWWGTTWFSESKVCWVVK